MPPRAHVTSAEALEAFRAKLIVYLSKARPTLDEVGADVLRLRQWLENDQRTLWERQYQARMKQLEEAQQALFSARIGMLRKGSAVEQMAFHRARRSVQEADDKLRVIRRWTRDFDNRVLPLLKQVEKLHTVLSHDMVQAAAYLAQAVATLAAYAGIPAPASVSEPTPAAGGKTGGEQAPADVTKQEPS
jgi:uncharacterized protein (UPF0305 family)